MTARSANGSCTPTEFSNGGSANATGVIVIREIRIGLGPGSDGAGAALAVQAGVDPLVEEGDQVAGLDGVVPRGGVAPGDVRGEPAADRHPEIRSPAPLGTPRPCGT